MANDLKEKDPIQEHYDDEFDRIKSPEDHTKEGGESDLSTRESRPDGSHDNVDLSPREQAQLEQMEAGIRNGELYDSSDNKKPGLRQRLSIKRHWKKYAIGGGLVGFVGGIGALLFVFLPTLKVTHFLNNIEQRFFGVATNAIEQRAEYLLSRYMRQYVFPSVSNPRCGTVVSIDCDTYDPGRGIVGNLYRNWSNGRIEEKLFTNHGIQIEYRGNDNYSIITSRGTSVDVNGSTFEISDLDRNDNVSGREVRRELRRVLAQETFWNRLVMRRGVRKLAESKWNIRWCLVACDTRDEIRERRISALHRLKLGLIERTVSPYSDRLGLYFTCAVTDCTSEKFQTERSRLISNAIEELGEDEVRRIIDEFDGGSRRLSQVAVEKVLSKLFGTAVGRAGASAVPFVGWLYLIDAVNQIDIKLYEGVISQYLADNNAAQYAEFYLTFRSHYNEGTTGQLSFDEVGAQNQLFDGVEGSRVYQQELGTAENPVANLFSSPVYAQEEEYVCGDGEPIPEGNMVCEERKVGRRSSYDSWRQTAGGSLLMNNMVGGYRCGPISVGVNLVNPEFCQPGSLADTTWPVDAALHEVFKVFNAVIDVIAGAVINVVRVLPGVGQLIDYFLEQVGQLLQLFLEVVFPFLDAGNGPGRQNFDDLYAGVDVVGNEFAKGTVDPSTGEQLGLGGRLLTDEEVGSHLAVIEQKEQEEFESKSLVARLLSPEEENSAITQIAVGLPNANNILEGANHFLAMLNPFQSIPAIAGGLINPSYAQERTYQGDPFGIDQYGYAVDDENLTIDPEELTEESCSPGGEYYERWVEGIIGDDPGEKTQSGQLMYTAPNPCMLEYTATNILGCWFTDEDDCGVGQAASTSGPGVGQVVVGDTSDLACEAGSDAGVGDGYAQGRLYKIRLCNVQGIVVNSQISGELNSLINDAAGSGINFDGGGFRTMESQISLRRSHCGTSEYDIYQKPSSQCSPPTARPGYSNHQMGLAVDFTCNGHGIINISSRPATAVCFNWLSANAEKYGLYNLPSENWHWSVDGK